MVQAAQPILVKLYGGSRFYDTGAGRYITFDGLADLWRYGEAVVVRDARTGEDITAAIMGRIIPRDE